MPLLSWHIVEVDWKSLANTKAAALNLTLFISMSPEAIGVTIIYRPAGSSHAHASDLGLLFLQLFLLKREYLAVSSQFSSYRR